MGVEQVYHQSGFYDLFERYYLVLSRNISKFFPLPSPIKTCALPFDFGLERGPKNIFYYQCDVENYTDQVLDFLLFVRHEYIHTESSDL